MFECTIESQCLSSDDYLIKISFKCLKNQRVDILSDDGQWLMNEIFILHIVVYTGDECELLHGNMGSYSGTCIMRPGKSN